MKKDLKKIKNRDKKVKDQKKKLSGNNLRDNEFIKTTEGTIEKSTEEAAP